MHSFTLTTPSPEELRELLKRHKVSRQDAATMLYVSINAIHKWTAKEGSQDYREMPLAAYELLLLKIGEHPTHKMVVK